METASFGRQYGGLTLAFDDGSRAEPSHPNSYQYNSLAHHNSATSFANSHQDMQSTAGREFRPSPNLGNWQVKAKRWFDMSFYVAAIIGLSPMLAIVSLAIVVKSRG